MMSRPIIETFLFDYENEEKIAAHGLSVYQVIQVLDNIHVILPNRKRRRGVYLVIGRDNGGSCISIPIERTNIPNLWRPITAWYCKKGEETVLNKSKVVK
jgi:uncharacterized DUF497 family protein